MKSLVFALVCLVAAPCAAADWNWAIAQAPPAVVSASQCSCGPDCPCSKEALEKYQTYKLYHDRMEEWLKSQGHRPTSRVVQTAAPVVVSRPLTTYTYADEEPVCVNGQCFLPSQAAYSPRTSTPYTGGRYTRWMGLRGGRFFGGSCANGSCN